MKIKYVQGDVTKAAEPIIAHGCNAQGVMGSGVARAIRDRFPVAYEAYRNQHELFGLTLGQVIWARYDPFDDRPSKFIANCITQRFYGRDGNQYVDYEAVRYCMKRINSDVTNGQNSPQEIKDAKAFALPKIGAGLGGGDWDIIAGIIEDECTHLQPVVYAYD